MHKVLCSEKEWLDRVSVGLKGTTFTCTSKVRLEYLMRLMITLSRNQVGTHQ